MTVLRSDIERALDDMISNEEGMRFQGLAVALAKQRWPEFIACERKKDLGADAIARASLAPDRSGKVLACSLTATLDKIEGDAGKIKENFPDITQLIFATPRRVTNNTAEEWTKAIRETFGFELVIVPREDFISSLVANLPLCQTHLGIAVSLEPEMLELAQKVRAATSEVIAGWSRRLAGNPFIELRAVRIDLSGRDTGEGVQLADIRAALAQSRRVMIEAPAGRGKTTTLAHLAHAHSDSGRLAFVVDLPGWATSKKDILEFIAGMRAFRSRSIDAAALARLYDAEHFSFFLNGWNEIAESESPHAVECLRQLEQDFPSAGILVATRAQRINPPLPGAIRVRLLPLDRTQRTEYLRLRLGPRSHELIAKLDGEPALKELTRTALMLCQVTDLFEAGLPIPATKMGVIESAMGLLEHRPEHSSHLRSVPLSGCASEYLIALAAAMTERGEVETAEEHARAVVSAVSAKLHDAGQIGPPPDQAEILDALCKYHVLERVEYPGVLFRFAHQQFQEFYAALLVKSRLRELVDGVADADGQGFTKRFLNEPGWSEPLRMIAAELGSADASPSNAASTSKAGSMLVEMALDTDCVFASELFRLCNLSAGSPCGRLLGERLGFLYRLPEEHFRQYALAGMLESGSDQFTDIIVPLLNDNNQQIRGGAYRLLNGIHVSSLGPQWQTTVDSWQEDARAEFFSEILHFGEAPRAILPYALADPSPKVHAVAISALDWLGAHDEMARALTSVDDPTFENAIKQLPHEYMPVDIRPRASAMYEAQFRESRDPSTRLRNLLKLAELSDGKEAPRFKEELDSYDLKRVGESWHPVIKPVLDIVRRTDPQWVSRWVVDRIADGVVWSDDWNQLVTSIPPDVKEHFLTRLETEDFKHVRHPRFVDLLCAAADSAMVERIFAKLCELRSIIERTPMERHEFEWAIETQLEELFRSLPPVVAVTGLSALLSREVEASELVVVTRLFGSIGRQDFNERIQLPDDLRQLLRTYLKEAVAVVLSDDSFGSRHIGNLSSALARIGEPEDLPLLRNLIHADIVRTQKAREAAARARAARVRPTPSEDCSPWNVRAVVLLDGDSADAVLLDVLKEPEYERVAAEALVKLASTEKVEEGFGKKKNYDKLWETRRGRGQGGFHESRRKRYAAALADRITAILAEWGAADAKEQAPYEFRLKELTKSLAALDASGSVPLILRVLSIPERVTSWSWKSLGIFETLLFNGVVLPADSTLKWFDAVLERVRLHRYDDQQVGLLLQALCLLPFIDTPAIGIAKVGEVIADLKLFAHQLRDVTLALGRSRCNDAIGPLRGFVASDNEAKQLGDEWINAVAALDSPESRALLMSFVDPEAAGLVPEVTFGREDVLAARLVDLARREPSIEQRLLYLCTTSLPASKRALLSRVMGWLGSSEAALAGLHLIDDTCSPPVPYEIWKQLEGVFVEQRSHGKDSNVYTPAPRSSNAIRNRLFEMATLDPRRNKSALSLLGQIEIWRLEYGRPHGEPRNPALGTRFPWPPIDMDN